MSRTNASLSTKSAAKSPAVAPTPPTPPGFPDYFTARLPDRRPPATLFEAVGRRLNDGIYRAACDLTAYICESASDAIPCDIHDIDDRAAAFAGLVRGIRELYLVPGCREALSALPACHDLFAYRS